MSILMIGSYLKNNVFKKGMFVSNVATLIAGTSLAQFVSVAVSPLLTRLYHPR